MFRTHRDPATPYRHRKSDNVGTLVCLSKANDLVTRHTLFILQRVDCGEVMLAALVAMCRVPEGIIRSTVVTTATLEVRHGFSTSCFLFIIFANELVKIIEEECCLLRCF